MFSFSLGFQKSNARVMVRLIPMQYAPILSTTCMEASSDSSVRRAMQEIEGTELDNVRQMGPGAVIP